MSRAITVAISMVCIAIEFRVPALGNFSILKGLILQFHACTGIAGNKDEWKFELGFSSVGFSRRRKDGKNIIKRQNHNK